MDVDKMLAEYEHAVVRPFVQTRDYKTYTLGAIAIVKGNRWWKRTEAVFIHYDLRRQEYMFYVKVHGGYAKEHWSQEEYDRRLIRFTDRMYGK